VYQCSLLKVKAWVSKGRRAPSPGYMQEPTLFSTEQASATPPLERARSISLAQVSLTMLLSASPEYSKVKHLRTYRKEEKEIKDVAPDIAAALKNNLSIVEKEQISGILFFYGKRSCLRSRHLVLWSLGTLTGQQRFYGSGLVT
jgi:hypothetical protein